MLIVFFCFNFKFILLFFNVDTKIREQFDTIKIKNNNNNTPERERKRMREKILFFFSSPIAGDHFVHSSIYNFHNRLSIIYIHVVN